MATGVGAGVTRVPYIHRATLLNVVDGDTVDLEVKLPFRLVARDRFRLYGINAPEMRGDSREAGKLAKSALASMIPQGEFIIKTHMDKQDKYGRWLVEISDGDESRTINDRMVREGFAFPYMVDS